MEEKIEKIKTIGIVLRPDTPEIKDYYEDVKKFLESKNIEPLLDLKSANMIKESGINFKYMCQKSDILLSLGGDGTLISLIRRSLEYQKPIMGVNLGKLGFLTDYHSNSFKEAINDIIAGNYRIDLRMALEVENVTKKEKHKAINDLVIRHKKAKMIHIRLYINKEPINNYYGDGLIVSTPTGSTGYNLSSGGPIVYPYAKNFIFTPICPHSLTQRPIVLPVNFDIDLEILEDDVIAVFDGQENFTLNKNEKIKVKMSDTFAKMIHRKSRNFFKAISDKLNWGD